MQAANLVKPIGQVPDLRSMTGLLSVFRTSQRDDSICIVILVKGN